MSVRPALLAAVLLVSACGPSPTADEGAEAGRAAVVTPARTPAPAVVLPTADGPVDLASLAGRPVVLQFASATDADAWAALADALADLEASGATVLAVTVADEAEDAARAFGYRGRPLAVVVDGEGSVRGSGAPDSGDALFALAGPVLAEADVAETVSWGGADTLDDLVRSGGLVVDVTEGSAPSRRALHVAADTLSVTDLPADLGTPLAFVGPDAHEAASSAVSWGYASVFVAEGDALTPVEPVIRAPRRPGTVRG